MLTLLRHSKKVIQKPSATKLFFTTSNINNISNSNSSSNNSNNTSTSTSPKQHQQQQKNNNNNNNNNNSRNSNSSNNNVKNKIQYQNNSDSNSAPSTLTNQVNKHQKYLDKLHPKVIQFYSSKFETDKKKRDYLTTISNLLYGVEHSKPTFYLFEEILSNEHHSIETIKFLFESIEFKGSNSSTLNFIFEQFVNYYLNFKSNTSNLSTTPSILDNITTSTTTTTTTAIDNSNNSNNSNDDNSSGSSNSSNNNKIKFREVQEIVNKIKKIVEDNDKVYFNSGFYNSLLRYYISNNSKKNMEQLVQKIIMTQKIEDEQTLSLLVIACLRIDNVTSAASLYNKLSSRPNLQTLNAFNEFLNYYLSKGTSESTNLAIKLFFRNLNTVPVFINSNYFLEFVEKVFQASEKSITNEILDIISKKNFVTSTIFLNIALHLLKQVNSSTSTLDEQKKQDYINMSKEIYYERVKVYKGLKTEDSSTKSILWCILSNDINELELLLMDSSKVKIDIHVTQRLFEFINIEQTNLPQHLQDKLNNLVLRNSNQNSLYLVLVYNELLNNKQLVHLLEDHLLNKSSNKIKHHTLNFIIQTYLSLDIYHLALNWLSKKITIYKSSPSVQIYKSFLQYHQEVSKNPLLEEFWSYKILNDNNELLQKQQQQQQQQHNNHNNNTTDNSELKSKTSISKSNNLKIKIVTNTEDSSLNNNNKILSIKEKKSNLELKWKLFEGILKDPLAFNQIKKLQLIPPSFTQHPILVQLFKNEDMSQMDLIIQKLLESFESDDSYQFNNPINLMPNQYNIIRAYRLVEKENLVKYIELLNRSPKYIRAIVFSPEAYNRIFEYDFKIGMETLMSEPQGIQQSQWIYDSLLQYFIKHDHSDLASIIIGKMLQLGRVIAHGEEFLKLLIKKDDHHSKAIIGPLCDYMMQHFKMSPSIANIEIIKMLDLGLIDEALEIFNLAPKNQDSILLGLRIYSKKYPIPPISNLMFWGSLSEIEKSVNPNGRVFYENFYRVLYENNLSHIIKLYGDKTNSVQYATPLELHYLLLAEKDDAQRLDLFSRYPNSKPILQETYDLVRFNLEYLPNTPLKQKLDSTTITSLSSNSNYKQIDDNTIQLLLNNFSTYKPALHDLTIINNQNDLRIIIKDQIITNNNNDNNNNNNNNVQDNNDLHLI